MELYNITGGGALHGNFNLPAAKNSVLPIMAACILCDGTTILNDIPRLSDVDASVQILRHLGREVKFVGNTLFISGEIIGSNIPQTLMSTMRSSVFYIAPILAKCKRVQFSQPGGCRLGPRPIDIHLNGLAAMGADIEENGDITCISIPNGLSGTEYNLRLPSVGATETLLMAGVVASGNTVLRGCATEPEIIDLVAFLRVCGADISGEGTSIIRINGGKLLHFGAEGYSLFKDRIVAATVLFAAAATGGDVTVHGGCAAHFSASIRVLEDMGCKIQVSEGTVHLVAPQNLNAIGRLYTDVFPAFCTDCAPLAAAALLKAKGKSVVTDMIFENRFCCADGFSALGANVYRDGRELLVNGVSSLQGAELSAPDLRGGAALLIAAMCAKGESVLYGIKHLNRGYENLAAVFNSLGAKIGVVEK